MLPYDAGPSRTPSLSSFRICGVESMVDKPERIKKFIEKNPVS